MRPIWREKDHGSAGAPSAAPMTSPQRFLPLALIGCALVLSWALGIQDQISFHAFLEGRHALKHWVDSNIVLAALGFTALYAIATALVFPAAAVLTIGGGFLFGWWLGGSLTVIGATIGACILFQATNSAFGGALRRRAGLIRRFADGFEKDAFSYLLVLRLSPVLPFSVVNVGPALIGVPFSTYALATFLGIIPGAMVYAFIGSGLDAALLAAGGNADSISDFITFDTTLALLGLAALSVLGLALKKWVIEPRRRAPERGGVSR
ncbi:TVP38/TMEM64 family protein [Consotaella salsifontis]|uniref:TVP38/TMEM64 family membrane protein n=1 Tax=Consotaella salsifontis TaxID=1365950 RepID=A0A1T4Q3F1_9HYPH|nr:TVP38/TMEM64 family protein [Consotaella salsifontis]SJZ98355.1 Uncharacterized membrane protein YdjX, TVP38/TMEM64 family, SNARE-associated domain [Consotaella salsifontis]